MRQTVDILEASSTEQLWIVRMRGVEKKQDPTPDIRRTATLPQNDIQQVRIAAEEKGIILRQEDDDPNDPIHDTSTKGGVANYNSSRKALHSLITGQFYHVDAKDLRMKIANKFSKQHPLNIDKIWQRIDLCDEGQAIANVQDGFFCFFV